MLFTSYISDSIRFPIAMRQVEVINLRIEAIGAMTPPPMPALDASDGRAAAIHTMRMVATTAGTPQEVPVYRRDALSAGHRLVGPAVVDQLDTTTVILERQQAQIDRAGNLIVSRL